jgi:hypothetical protein
MCETKVLQKLNTFYIPKFWGGNLAFLGVIGKNTVQPEGRRDSIIQRLRIAYWIPKATNTHSEYVTIIAFPLQKYLYERASMLRYVNCLHPKILSAFRSLV